MVVCVAGSKASCGHVGTAMDDTRHSERALRRQLMEAQLKYREDCSPERAFEYVRALIAFKDCVSARKKTRDFDSKVVVQRSLKYRSN